MADRRPEPTATMQRPDGNTSGLTPGKPRPTAAMAIPGGPRRLSVPLLAGTLNLPVSDLSSSMPPPGATAMPTFGSAVFGGPSSFSPPSSLADRPMVVPTVFHNATAGGRKPSLADVWRPPYPAAAVSPTDDNGRFQSPDRGSGAERLSRRASLSEDYATSPSTEPDRGDPMMKKIINCQMLDF